MLVSKLACHDADAPHATELDEWGVVVLSVLELQKQKVMAANRICCASGFDEWEVFQYLQMGLSLPNEGEIRNKH